MTDNEIRIAVAEACGFTGCHDVKCKYRKCQHLHKQGAVYFPESYSIPMYPNYPSDMNACASFEETLTEGELCDYGCELAILTEAGKGDVDVMWGKLACATARQRCEAFLKVKGLWKP